MKKGILIYNPVAGRRPARREREVREAAAVLRQAGLEIELAPTARPAMAHELAQAAAARGVDVVLVCGGDGTINEVVNGLVGSHVPLGILPGGTANIVARELRLPLHPVRAARQLPRWTPRRIALGHARWEEAQAATPASEPAPHACCRHYISVAGIGFDAHIVYKLSAWLKKEFGVTAYVMEALRRLPGYSFPSFSSRLDGIERQGTFAVIHRTRLYAGWLHLAPTAGLFQPCFAVCSFPSRSHLRYLLYALAVLARQHLRMSGVSLDNCTEVVCTPVDASATIRFELDGELAGVIPATFEIVPDALTVLVP
ncbi:MAG TPA: diacylglycerol kinase family protein [Terriglobia bacterium]|nr:diacylglycerol kinase family protein [Terriglobia bacterium]